MSRKSRVYMIKPLTIWSITLEYKFDPRKSYYVHSKGHISPIKAPLYFDPINSLLLVRESAFSFQQNLPAYHKFCQWIKTLAGSNLNPKLIFPNKAN